MRTGKAAKAGKGAAMRLNLGCGRMHLEGFINIDSNPDCTPDVLCDAAAINSICGEEEADEIVAYDIIEHFDRKQIPTVLKYWRSRLKPNGILHLRTNDWDRLMRLYILGKFLGHNNPVDFDKLVWHFMCEHETPGMGHKWGFNRETMGRAITEAGFSSYTFTPEAFLSAGQYPYAEHSDHSNLLITAVK
jgi:predicted SAM-dependent methyltransferase